MPALACTIRPAHARDVDAIHAIEVASFADPWKRDGFRDLIKQVVLSDIFRSSRTNHPLLANPARN